jgi:hypothetical protein
MIECVSSGFNSWFDEEDRDSRTKASVSRRFGFKPRCFLNFHAPNIEHPSTPGFPEFVNPLPFFAKWL